METQPEQDNSASIPVAKPAATQPKEANSASSPTNKHITSDVPATTPKIKKPRSGCCWQENGRAEQTSSRSKKKKQEAPKSKTKALKPEEKLDSNKATTFLGLVA